MHYMLLIYSNEKEWESVSPADAAAGDAQCDRYIAELTRAGQFVSAGQLQPSGTATTYRETAGKPVITDGPFAETKEVLGGFVLVDCKDLDEALAVAARFPFVAQGVSVEVRPLVPAGANPS